MVNLIENRSIEDVFEYPDFLKFRSSVTLLRYSLCRFDVAALGQILVQVNRPLKRGKAFEEGRVQGRMVAALDGIEVLSSYSRCCESCLERRVVSRRAGVKVEQVQYYHRALGSPPWNRGPSPLRRCAGWAMTAGN